MAELERDFKGVWIPKEVWLDTRLNALDKIILTEIDSLDRGEIGCYASNKYIAEFCQCSETKVSKSISLLIKLGYLYVQNFDGRTRYLKSNISGKADLPKMQNSFVKNAKQPCKKDKADLQKVQESNIYNNIDNNTENNNATATAADGEKELKLMGGKLGKGKVMLTNEQFNSLCDQLSLDEINTYIEKLADFIIDVERKTGKPPMIKSHYKKILEWVIEDRQL